MPWGLGLKSEGFEKSEFCPWGADMEVGAWSEGFAGFVLKLGVWAKIELPPGFCAENIKGFAEAVVNKEPGGLFSGGFANILDWPCIGFVANGLLAGFGLKAPVREAPGAVLFRAIVGFAPFGFDLCL